MKFKSLVCALLTAVVSSNEKTKEVITAAGRWAEVPRVGAEECQEWCAFKNEVEQGKYSEFCYIGTPPTIRGGWEWYQQYGPK